jgi:hypothetical protein
VIVGAYTVGLPIKNAILVELKAIEALDINQNERALNCLKATDMWLCLLRKSGNARLGIRCLLDGPYQRFSYPCPSVCICASFTLEYGCDCD